MFEIHECPRTFIGSDFVAAVNLAGMSGKGDWPVAGGLLDQAAWFINLQQTLTSEQNRIEREQIQRNG